MYIIPDLTSEKTNPEILSSSDVQALPSNYQPFKTSSFLPTKNKKKQPLWEHSLLILIKTFFKNEILRGSLISQKFPRSAGGVCIKPKQHLADRARLIFCSKFLAPGEGNQTCQVRGGTSPPPPLPSVDYHTGVVGIKWSLATVIGPSNYVTNWP